MRSQFVSKKVCLLEEPRVKRKRLMIEHDESKLSEFLIYKLPDTFQILESEMVLQYILACI